MSPKVIRDLKLFCLLDDDQNSEIEITAIHDDLGYKKIREQLAHHYNLSAQEPNIQIYSVNLRGDRSITLHHRQQDRIPLNREDAAEVLKHFHRLWGFDVHLESISDGKVTAKFVCNDESLKAGFEENEDDNLDE